MIKSRVMLLEKYVCFVFGTFYTKFYLCGLSDIEKEDVKSKQLIISVIIGSYLLKFHLNIRYDRHNKLALIVLVK